MNKYSYISNAEVNAIDDLYKRFKEDPESVDISWKRFFEGFEFANQQDGLPAKEYKIQPGEFISLKELGVRNLIHAFRTRGHLKSDTNPVRPRRKHNVLLELTDFGLSNDDLDVEYEYEVGQVIGQHRLVPAHRLPLPRVRRCQLL